jgi:hypothetical protein
MEAVGLLAPHAVRVASETRLERHLSDYVAAQEKIAADNDIEGRQKSFDTPYGVKGIDAELLRREMAKCDHGAFLAAQEELDKLRGAAVALIVPFLKRLVASFDEALNASAIEAEKRFEAEALRLSVAIYGRCIATGSVKRSGLGA